MRQILKTDMCIYGGTSGGVTAAVAAARCGRSVVLVEPTRHLGGLTSSGLGWTDYGRRESIGGLSGDFYRQVGNHYAANGTPASEHAQGPGWTHEPHVAEAIFENWIAGRDIEVIRESRLAGVEMDGRTIRAILLDHAPPDGFGNPAAEAVEEGWARIEAAIFIDASYEGDLMAMAGVSYTTRREPASKYGESMAGVIFTHWENHDGTLRGTPTPEATRFPVSPYRTPDDPASGLLPFIEEGELPEPGVAGGNDLQAYNFRLCLTDDPANRLPIEPIGDYDPALYELLGRWTEIRGRQGDPVLPAHFHGNTPNRVFKISPLPNRKSDVNNADSFSSDFVGANLAYPDGKWATRARIWQAHQDYQRGLHYFMRTDPRVPDAVREEAARWGLARDEFADTGGWPFQLYVRECRRMLGDRVVTQSDCNGKRTVDDAIALGSYTLDSHYCRRFAWRGGIVNEGNFMHRIKQPYGISYRALTPRESECGNLLVLFCLSASHAAYSSLRMEPVLMMLGESAAIAAHQALDKRRCVQWIDVPRLQAALLDAGQILKPQ